MDKGVPMPVADRHKPFAEKRCARCNEDEFRIDGYCTIYCRNMAEVEAELDAYKDVRLDLLSTKEGLERKLEQAESEREALAEALFFYNPRTNGLVGECAVCHKHPICFDYVVSDEMWNDAVPRKLRPSVICLDCFEDMTGGIPTGEWRMLYYTSKAGTVAFLPIVALPASLRED